MNVAETIKAITREHLTKNGGCALGQCLTAVGWVGGTVPEMTEADGLVELSTADVAGCGIAVGMALAGKRPIYIVRYQGFQWYDAPSVVNYAAKSKAMWDLPCPIFVRSIAMDGGIGPVASGSHHSIFTRMPGIVVCAPMTPCEYHAVWDFFMSHDDPVHVSEHRRSFSIDYEMNDMIKPNADITLFPISSTRLNAIEAASILENEGIVCNIVHLVWIHPFPISEVIVNAISESKYGGLVIDGDFENGVVKCLAFDLAHASGKYIDALGLEDRTAGFAPPLDNLPPTKEKICQRVRHIVTRRS